jgi:hypothetical protein
MYYVAYVVYPFLQIQPTHALHVLHQLRTSQEVFLPKQLFINAEDASVGTSMQGNGWHVI